MPDDQEWKDVVGFLRAIATERLSMGVDVTLILTSGRAEQFLRAAEMLEDAETRLEYARATLRAITFFEEDQIGLDVAPRIAEYLRYANTENRELRRKLKNAKPGKKERKKLIALCADILRSVNG